LNKGQVFSLDTILAIGIFLMVFMVTISVWDGIDRKKILVESRDEMEFVAQNAALVLFTTSGLPTNWDSLEINSESVDSLGLSDSKGVLSTDKLVELETQNIAAYEEFKEILGIRGPGYEFYAQIFYDPGDQTLLGDTPVIAYSYANSAHGADEGDLEHFGIRNYMDENEIEYTNYHEDWAALIADITDFNILILEDPVLDKSDLSRDEQDALTDWVAAGNIFIQKEKGRIFELFDLKYINFADNQEGTVTVLDYMIKGVEIGDKVICIEGYELNKNFGNIVNLVTAGSGHVLIGYSQYSLGRVYYFCDTEGTVYDIGDTQKYNNIRTIINFGGGLASYKFGKPVKNSKQVVRIERAVYLDNGLSGRAVFKVWRDE